MICNRNMNMSLGPYVWQQEILRDEKICLLDIGAREGIQPVWQQIAGCLKFIGFEPDLNECERINSIFGAKGLNWRLYPYAVHDVVGSHSFHVTRFPHSSGFQAANPKFNSRFSEINCKNLEIIKDVVLKTVTLDKFITNEQIPAVDFIKIDTEGSEHSVLQGGKSLLNGSHLLGVESEFWAGPIKASDNFPIIHTLLTKFGFYLFDINIGRYPRKVFPRGFLEIDDKAGTLTISQPHRYGQILTGDVVYLRDPVWELENGVERFCWNDISVLKMAMIYELYQLYDCAVELLHMYKHHFTSDLEFEKLFDLLTPAVQGMGKMKYRQYVYESMRLPWSELNSFQPHWIK